MKETETKIYVTNQVLLDKIRCGVYTFTNGKVKVGHYINSGRDTEYTYCLVFKSDRKLAKSKISELVSYISGLADGVEMTSKLIILKS